MAIRAGRLSNVFCETMGCSRLPTPVTFPLFAAVDIGFRGFTLHDIQPLARRKLFGPFRRALVRCAIHELDRCVDLEFTRQRLAVEPLVIGRFEVRNRLRSKQQIAAVLPDSRERIIDFGARKELQFVNADRHMRRPLRQQALDFGCQLGDISLRRSLHNRVGKVAAK